jgi:hypothetical protein
VTERDAMRTQTNFSGRSPANNWNQFLDGLQHGHLSAYLLLFAFAAGMSVAVWAGTNMMRKETRR